MNGSDSGLIRSPLISNTPKGTEMSKTLYIAVAQIEQLVDGKRVYVDPDNPISLGEDDAATFLKLKAVRLPNKQEAELNALREESARSAAEKAEPKATKGKAAKGAADGDSDI